MTTYDDWKKRRSKPRATAVLAADAGLHDQLQDVRRRAQAIRADAQADGMMDQPQDAIDLDEEARQLEERIRESGVEFVFEAMGHKPWSDLMAKHPPDDDQKAKRFQYNPRSFEPAAIQASLVEPEMTDAEFAEFFDDLNEGEFMELWSACLAANVSGGGNPEALTATEEALSSQRKQTSQRT